MLHHVVIFWTTQKWLKIFECREARLKNDHASFCPVSAFNLSISRQMGLLIDYVFGCFGPLLSAFVIRTLWKTLVSVGLSCLSDANRLPMLTQKVWTCLSKNRCWEIGIHWEGTCQEGESVKRAFNQSLRFISALIPVRFCTVQYFIICTLRVINSIEEISGNDKKLLSQHVSFVINQNVFRNYSSYLAI